MTEDHPNIAVLNGLDLRDIAASGELFADDVVWHYANPNLPELQGDYVGLEGVGTFFAALASKSGGTFRINPYSITPVGEELVVVQSRNTLSFDHRTIAVDVVVVWRIVNGRIVDVWDIVPGDAKEIKDD